MKHAYKKNLLLATLLGLIGLTVAGTVWPAQRSQAEGATSPQAPGKLWAPAIAKRAHFGSPSNPTPTPTTPPTPTGNEWTQDAHNAQRTGFTSEEPVEPWTLIWAWNGPDASGGTGNHIYDAPREARTVTGGGHVYAPAGQAGLYALAKSDGHVGWHLTNTSFNATPAFDPATGYVFAGGADGRLYKIHANTGSVAQTYNAGSPINESVLLVGSAAFIVTENGQLHKVNTANMSRAWMYAGGSPGDTSAAYSASRGIVIFCTADLYVHAVNTSNGTQKWRVKPTVNPAQDPFTFDGYWPVVAEQNGIVFVRLNLGMDGLWSGPGHDGIYPPTNAEIRQYLVAEPQWKNLFALDLDNGAEAFVPAVGFGGVEYYNGQEPVLEVGPVPVIKVYPGNVEVAYMLWRAGQYSPEPPPPDGRWDSHLGEMVLNNSTIPNLTAGDLRFVDFPNAYEHITDEQCPLSMAGDTIFHAHWGANESARITDRSATRGLVHSNPILMAGLPAIIRRQQSCPDFDPTTHWTSCGLTLFQDGRYWEGPGWWVYWNVQDPNITPNNGNRSGILPRYTYVSDGLVIVESNGGELFVYRHSGD
jgi:outer membrane protein assembly factor BamB